MKTKEDQQRPVKTTEDQQSVAWCYNTRVTSHCLWVCIYPLSKHHALSQASATAKYHILSHKSASAKHLLTRHLPEKSCDTTDFPKKSEKSYLNTLILFLFDIGCWVLIEFTCSHTNVRFYRLIFNFLVISSHALFPCKFQNVLKLKSTVLSRLFYKLTENLHWTWQNR